MAFKGSQYIWKDRKRYLGLPISFTRYAMTEDRLFLSTGFLNIKDEEVLLYRIRDINTTRTLGQRLFGVGTVHVVSSDKSLPAAELKNIRRPLEVKELLHRQVEDMKILRRVRLGEVVTSDEHDCDCDDSDLDDLDDMEDV